MYVLHVKKLIICVLVRDSNVDLYSSIWTSHSFSGNSGALAIRISKRECSKFLSEKKKIDCISEKKKIVYTIYRLCIEFIYLSIGTVKVTWIQILLLSATTIYFKEFSSHETNTAVLTERYW